MKKSGKDSEKVAEYDQEIAKLQKEIAETKAKAEKLKGGTSRKEKHQFKSCERQLTKLKRQLEGTQAARRQFVKLMFDIRKEKGSLTSSELENLKSYFKNKRK